ncbi:MAG TPA: hypothetical protein VFS88_03515 [Micavibrio sp.]|nr:hypothetical protein [Micavibrio sp.]
MATLDLRFTDSTAIKGREDRYTMARVSVSAILKNWRLSLFSFEWLNPDGSIRTIDELSVHERDKRVKIEKTLAAGGRLERPVLGIGLLDNVEIGAGRDIFLTLAAKGAQDIEVHIPVSNLKDFKQFVSG